MNFQPLPPLAIDLLAKGDLINANKLLGFEYSLAGTVVHGDHLGIKLGFPTANLLLDTESPLLLPYGVYLISVLLGKAKKYGLSSIGIRPTVGGKDLRVEVHIFDYNGNLYQQRLHVFFMEHLRDELKFNSLQELILQMERDKLAALALLAGRDQKDSDT
jgi:riboflavin kinase/FMN adenylyltransferase